MTLCVAKVEPVALEQGFSNLSGHQSHVEGELKLRWLGSSPGDSDSIEVEGESKLCTFNKLSDDNDLAGLGTIH